MKRKPILIFALLVVLCFTACENPLEIPTIIPETPTNIPVTSKPGYGMVTVNINDSGNLQSSVRTVYPSMAFAKFAFVFSKLNDNREIIDTLEPKELASNATFVFELEVGKWQVTVTAFTKAEDTEPVAIGTSEPFTLTSNSELVTANVQLDGTANAGNGNFNYYVTYPVGAEVTSFLLEKLPQGGDTSIDLLDEEICEKKDGELNTLILSGSAKNIHAGYYFMTIILEKDGKETGSNEVVYIYDKLDSSYGTENAPIVFTEDHFSKNNIIELTEGVWADGDLPSSNDEQWFKFTATAATQYIHVNRGTLTLLYVQLYNSTGTTVGVSTLMSSSTSNTSRTVTIGNEYYIKVTPLSSYKGTYKIGFTSTLIPPSVTLIESLWVDGNIPTSSGEQWFKFTATAATQYIHFNTGTLNNVYIQLYDSTGATVGANTNLSSSAFTTLSTSRTLTNGSDYYIKVTSSTGSGTYRIAFNASSETSTIGITLPTANITQLTVGVWVDGNIPISGGEQWFKFTATVATQYIHFNTGTLNNVYIQLYDSTEAAVGANTNLSGSTLSTSRTLTNSSEYYIKVTPYSSTGSGSYKIAITTTIVPPGLSLTTLTANTWKDGNISSGGEQWFKFTAKAAPQYIHFNTSTLKNVNIQLYDSTGFKVGTSSNSDITSRTVTVGSEYYIKVTSSYSGSYKIAITTTIAPPGLSLKTLTANTWADGNITTSTGEQWFKFTATAGTQYIHVNFGTLNTNLGVRVYDLECNEIGSINYLSYFDASFISRTVTIGKEYYVRVIPSDNSGTYKITFTTTVYPPDKTITPLTDNTWVNGNVTPSNNEWYSFTATASVQYIHIIFGTTLMLNSLVYDSVGNKVVGGGGQVNSKNQITVTVGQKYYFIVEPKSSTYNNGEYKIAINTSSTPPPQ